MPRLRMGLEQSENSTPIGVVGVSDEHAISGKCPRGGVKARSWLYHGETN